MVVWIVVVSVMLITQPWSTVGSTSHLLSPLLSPAFEDVCKEVKCGKGDCKASQNSTVPYECECTPGWKQVAAASDDDDNDRRLKFLPCVIPNCTFDFACSEAAPPVQEKENQGNESIFDVCRWTDCGGGKCKTTSLFTHECECSEGYTNLLNVTFFPCFKQCSLGMDCKGLGLSFTNKSTSSPPPSLPANGSNRGRLKLEGIICLLIFALALLAI